MEHTLGTLLRERARVDGTRPALIGAGQRLTWAELDAEADRVAARLVHLGLRPGDVLGLATAKRPEVVVTFLAAARAGVVVAPVNHKLLPEGVTSQLADAGVTALLAEPALAWVAELAAARVGARLLWVDDTWDRTAPHVDLPAVAPDDVVYLNTTSGTTGEPKAALTTHAQILANARITSAGLGFGVDEVFLGMFSVFTHPHELFHRPLLTGAATVILDSLSPRVVAQTIAAHRVTWMMAVPSFYEMILDHADPGLDLGSLRVLEAGGAVLHPDTVARLESSFAARVLPVWGSTETSGVALRAGADGHARVLPGYAARVVDAEGQPCPPGARGELQIQGPALVSGYRGRPEATAAVFRDGWYATGDVFTALPDGSLRFEGRATHMMKVGGIRVYPLEIERALVLHPDVLEAVVVAAHERIRGEVPRAIVRLAPDAAVGPRVLRRWCRQHLPTYKVPRTIEVWEAIPRLASGKVDLEAVRTTPPVRD